MYKHALCLYLFTHSKLHLCSGKMALLVPKGIQRYPDSGDTVKVQSYHIMSLETITKMRPQQKLRKHNKNCKINSNKINNLLRAQIIKYSAQPSCCCCQTCFSFGLQSDIGVSTLYPGYERTLISN